MLSKHIFVLLFCWVYGVLSISPFFEKGQRPELYELMDNEMPTLRINISGNELEKLKEEMKDNDNLDLLNNNELELDYYLAVVISEVKNLLKFLKRINFNEVYSGYNFDEILPQLQIGEDGYAQFDIEEVFAGFDYDPEHYEEYRDQERFIISDMVYNSNKDFDLNEIITQIGNMKMTISEDKFLNIVGNISFESWENEQFNKYLKNKSVINSIIKNNINVNDSGFKTKNATMTFEINGNISSFENVTFKVAGALSRYFSKPMFNIKIRKGEELYSRSHFKLRSDMYDPTLLRSKLISDIRNRVGIKSISANYVQFYLNDEFMGLYVMTDVINLPWIEDVYGDKKSTTLYKCNSLYDFTTEYSFACVNKNEDVTDDSEWINFLQAVENAKSASDLENILDIDHLLYEMAIEYLIYATDHALHNFYMYKQPNGKWTYISHDFDLDFNTIDSNMLDEDYFKHPYVSNRGRFYDLFISPDHERFNNILKEIVNKVINPATLYSHIDEIKQFIKPYVKLDKTPNSDGKYPGEINENTIEDIKSFSFEEWERVSEFYPINDNKGLKYIILHNYRLICNQLNMECDPIYMDENYFSEYLDYYPITNDEYSYTTNYEIPTEVPTEISIEIPTEILTEIPTEIPTEYNTNSSSIEPFIEIETVYDVDEPTFSTDEESSFDEEDTTESVESIQESVTIKTITRTQTIIYTTISN